MLEVVLELRLVLVPGLLSVLLQVFFSAAGSSVDMGSNAVTTVGAGTVSMVDAGASTGSSAIGGGGFED